MGHDEEAEERPPQRRHRQRRSAEGREEVGGDGHEDESQGGQIERRAQGQRRIEQYAQRRHRQRDLHARDGDGQEEGVPAEAGVGEGGGGFPADPRRAYILQCAAMPLLDRLVLREIAVPLGVGLLAIVQLLVILQLLQLNEVVFGSAITLSDLARMTAALAPHFLVVAVPLAFMLGVQLGLGRLAGNQELLALSAAGSIPAPVPRAGGHRRAPLGSRAGACALGGALGAAGAEQGAQRRDQAQLQEGLEPGIFNDQLPRFMVYVTSEDGSRAAPSATWQGVLIEDDVGDGAPLLALAETGRDRGRGRRGAGAPSLPRRAAPHGGEGRDGGPFREGSFLVGVQGPLSMKNRFAGNEASLTEEQIRARIPELRRMNRPREAARLEVDLARRWGVPFACVLFAFLGVPLAVATRGTRGSAYLITMAVFIAFYALQRFGVALAENGMNPWVAGLLPDAVVAAMGAAYTRVLVRSGVGTPR